MTESTENPYVSPKSETLAESQEVVTSESSPDVPPWFTWMDGLVLTGGMIVGLCAESALGAEEVLNSPMGWGGLLLKAIGWVILARVFRFAAMPRAWEWALLLAWAGHWPTRLGGEISTLLYNLFPGSGVSPEDTALYRFSLIAMLSGLVISGVIMIVGYLMSCGRLSPFSRVVALAMLWFNQALLVRVASLLWNETLATSNLGFDEAGENLLIIAVSLVVFLPGTIVEMTATFAGYRRVSPVRRWTEWAGGVYCVIHLWVSFVPILQSFATRDYLPEYFLTIVLGVLLGLLIAGLWRKRLADWLALSDGASTIEAKHEAGEPPEDSGPGVMATQ